VSGSSLEELLVTVSIDTECDHDPRWTRSDPLSFASITDGIPDRLTPAFAAVGAVPTYLLTVEVMEDEASVTALRALDAPHELGTHLHAAFIAPDKQFDDYAGVDSPDFQCSSPSDIERAKLSNLTALFVDRFGYSPTSFRAGRYGAGANTIDSLEALGYAVDTSVVPGKVWREQAPAGRLGRLASRLTDLVPLTPPGVVDTRRAPEQPYFPAPGSIARAGPATPGRLLEVPVSVRPNSRWPGLREPTWFRPWFTSVEDMKAVVRHQMHRHPTRRVLAINMMFHSMEIIEKASPYPQTTGEVQRFIDDMQAALGWCAEEGARFVPLSALREHYTPAGEG